MASKTLGYMVDLIANNNPYWMTFPDELLVAIFWEETMFQNIEQIKGKNGQVGLGFGQVQEDSLPLIASRMGKSFARGLITHIDSMSVEVASYCLEALRRGFQTGSPESAYKVGYAGATPTGRNQILDGRTRGQIADAVWSAHLDLVACTSWDDRDTVQRALSKARPANSSIFDEIFS